MSGGCERALRCLIDSKVVGLNPDGSVWVSGGVQWKFRGERRSAWVKGERYAVAGSPMAATIARLIDEEDL